MISDISSFFTILLRIDVKNRKLHHPIHLDKDRGSKRKSEFLEHNTEQI